MIISWYCVCVIQVALSRMYLIKRWGCSYYIPSVILEIFISICNRFTCKERKKIFSEMFCSKPWNMMEYMARYEFYSVIFLIVTRSNRLRCWKMQQLHAGLIQKIKDNLWVNLYVRCICYPWNFSIKQYHFQYCALHLCIRLHCTWNI